MNITRTLACLIGINAFSLLAFTAECRGQDFNGDGTPDFIEAVAVAPGVPTSGAVLVRSGVDNAVLLQIDAPAPDDAFGWDFEVHPDLNGDGVPEIVVAAPRSHLWTDAIGRVFVYSGANGDRLFSLRGRRGDRIGFTLGGSHDVNADGVPDVFATGMRLDPIGIPTERHFWFSGATGDMLFDQSYPYPGLKPAILEPLSVWGDLNQDDELDVGDLIELDPLVQEGAPPQEGGDLNEDLTTDDLDLDMLVDAVIAGEPVIADEDRLLPVAEWNELASVLTTWASLYPEDPIAASIDPAGWIGGTTAHDYWNNGRLSVSGQSVVPGTTQTVCNIDPIGLGQRVEGIAPAGCPDCNAQVEITSAPDLIRLGEPFTVEALWGNDCDERYWVVQFGTMTVGPIYADTLTYQIDFFEGFEDQVIIKAVCVDTEGNCQKIATVTVPFADCALDLAGCPWEVVGGDEITLTATAVPPGGTFTWTLTDEACYVASVSQRDSTFRFTLRETPTCNPRFGFALYVTAVVTYELNGCVKQKVCIFPIRFDSDGDGLFDDEESDTECPFGSIADSDGDGVPDGEEGSLGLDPCNDDTNGDGILDSCDIYCGANVTATSDIDGDGLKDRDECQELTDPRNPDTDGDGVFDGYERPLGFDPLDADTDDDGIPDGLEDRDNDGLADWEELANGTGVDNPDSDGDGLLDGEEVTAGIDPLDFDSDGDGLYDAEEGPLGLSPSDSDSDNDGIPDGNEDADGDGLSNRLEIFHGSDPLNPDTDGDGVSDGAEVAQGSSPVEAWDRGQPIPIELLREVHVDLYMRNGHTWELHVGAYTLRPPPFDEWGKARILDTLLLPRWQTHRVWMKHIGHEQVDPDCTFDSCDDYWYTLSILSPSSCDPAPLDRDDCDGYLCDLDGLLGSHSSDCCDESAGKSVYLAADPANVTMDYNNDGTIDVLDEHLEEANPYVDTSYPSTRLNAIVYCSEGDADLDGIPDYADGMNSIDGTAGKSFAPLHLRVDVGGQDVPPFVMLHYDGFDPQAVTRTEVTNGPRTWTQYGLGTVFGGQTLLRVWKRDGDQIRDPRPVQEGGDWVEPFIEYTSEELGLDPNGLGRLYVECVAVDPSDPYSGISITAKWPSLPELCHVDESPNGDPWGAVDEVHFSCYSLRLWPLRGEHFDDNIVRLSTGEVCIFGANEARPFHYGAHAAVGGAVTDGAALCVAGATLDLTSLQDVFTISIRKPGQAVINRPDALGGFSPYPEAIPISETLAQYTLPSIPMPEDGSEYACETNFTASKALFCPPPSYLDPTRHAGIPSSLALDSNESFGMVIEVKRNGTVVHQIPFVYRRPPIVLVHGLMGAPLMSWATADWDGDAALPVPTRIYRADYEATNTFGFSENYTAVPAKIADALHDYRIGVAPIITGPVPHHLYFAAARADVVGHSMGGCVTRFYIADISGNFPRGHSWAPLEFNRADGVSSFNRPYLRRENLWGGDIRRFFSIGTPFDGSPIADTVEPLLRPTILQMTAIIAASGTGAISDELGSMLFADWSPGGVPLPTSYIPPTAVRDLEVDSIAQRLCERGAHGYPSNNRAVRWHPTVGIATNALGTAPVEGALWELLFYFAPLVDNGGTDVAPLNPTNSDLIVEASSQHNTGGFFGYLNAAEGTEFDFTLHMSIPGLSGWQVETQHPGIITNIGDLMSGPPSAMGTGVLWP